MAIERHKEHISGVFGKIFSRICNECRKFQCKLHEGNAERLIFAKERFPPMAQVQPGGNRLRCESQRKFQP
jgi:hypothetical protein